MRKQPRILFLAIPFIVFVFTGFQLAVGQELQQRLAIPKAIVAEAKRRLIPLTAIRLSGKKWIACIENQSQGEYCISLGEDDLDIGKSLNTGVSKSILLNYGDQVSIERYGQQALELPVLPGANSNSSLAEFGTLSRESDEALRFEIRSNCEARINVSGRNGKRSLDTLPRFRRESSRLVRTTNLAVVSKCISQNPEEPFLVVITVPGHCEPCRRMDQVIGKYHGSEQPEATKIKTFILEYFTFSDAENSILGQGAVFPTTIVFAKNREPRKSSLPSLAIGFPNASGIESLSKHLDSGFKRASPSGIARGLLSLQSLHELIRTSEVVR